MGSPRYTGGIHQLVETQHRNGREESLVITVGVEVAIVGRRFEIA